VDIGPGSGGEGGAGPGRGEDHRLPGRVQQAGGAASGMQVVVECPAGGGVPVGLAAGVAGLLGGVGAQQIVEGVPAGDVLGQQAGAGQPGQCLAGLVCGDGGQAGGGGGGDIGSGVQAQQPEHPRRRLG